ncbi:uncharacterized protein DS421_16g544100 [Arachis hypogaea]|nr:uncharacterized protein DS421_16g544100 [Arachis hypogaea]
MRFTGFGSVRGYEVSFNSTRSTQREWDPREEGSVAGGGLAPSPPSFVRPCYAVATIPSVAQPYPRFCVCCNPFVELRRASSLRPTRFAAVAASAHRRKYCRRRQRSVFPHRYCVAVDKASIAAVNCEQRRRRGGREAEPRDRGCTVTIIAAASVVHREVARRHRHRKPPLELLLFCYSAPPQLPPRLLVLVKSAILVLN